MIVDYMSDKNWSHLREASFLRNYSRCDNFFVVPVLGIFATFLVAEE